MIEFIKVVQAGNQLDDPAGGKSIQEKSNLAGIILAGIIWLVKTKYPDFIIPEEVANWLLNLIGAALGAINLYFTRATTTKKF